MTHVPRGSPRPRRRGRDARRRAQILTGDIVLGIEEGDTLTIPPGITHAFGAATGSDADLLIVLTPGVERFGYSGCLRRSWPGSANRRVCSPSRSASPTLRGAGRGSHSSIELAFV